MTRNQSKFNSLRHGFFSFCSLYLRLYKGEALQRQWKIESDLISIGRSEANDIVLPSTGVSKYHAIIVRGEHALTVIDQNSANGVYVNDQRIEKHKLQY